MQTHVWLLRHAESAIPALFHGAESDIGLSEYGHRQAAAVAQLLQACNPDAVISSQMRRAVSTAQPIADACGHLLETEFDLHERKIGTLSGTSNLNAEQGIWPDTLRAWIAGDTAYSPVGVESFDQIQARVLPVWQQITTRHAGQSIVVVAHGIVIKVLLLSILPGWSVADWSKIGRIANVSITELTGSGTSWNADKIGEVPAIVTALPYSHPS